MRGANCSRALFLVLVPVCCSPALSVDQVLVSLSLVPGSCFKHGNMVHGRLVYQLSWLFLQTLLLVSVESSLESGPQ
jgi:hypothetical protein